MALDRAGLGIADLDVIESGEDFAAKACAVARELTLHPERVNPNGSSIPADTPRSGSAYKRVALLGLRTLGQVREDHC
ncbi:MULTISPECIES: hypothetical protein [Rhizobiaceae]|jgi:acetyl-CoA C-acetyltransferase|uniref:hypothetical protein n=1 Tax=Rhizobium sp. 11_C7_N12_5 TaxID=3240770 RepID=UPI00055F93EA